MALNLSLSCAMEETRVEVGRPRGAGKPRKLAPQRRQRNLWFAIPAVVGIVTIFAYAATGWPRERGPEDLAGRGARRHGARGAKGRSQGRRPPILRDAEARC